MTTHCYNTSVGTFQAGCLLRYRGNVGRDHFPEEAVPELSLTEVDTNMWEFKD